MEDTLIQANIAALLERQRMRSEELDSLIRDHKYWFPEDSSEQIIRRTFERIAEGDEIKGMHYQITPEGTYFCTLTRERWSGGSESFSMELLPGAELEPGEVPDLVTVVKWFYMHMISEPDMSRLKKMLNFLSLSL